MQTLIGTKRQLAAMLNLSERRITDLVTAGVLPVRGPAGFELAASVRGYIAFLKSKTGDLTAERARLTKAQADLAELKLRAKTGELVLRDAVEKAVFSRYRSTRDNLLNIPARESGIVASFGGDQEKIHQELTRAIHATLEELSHEHTDSGPGAVRPHRARA